MPQSEFRVSNTAGMWLRSQPIVDEATEITLLPVGQRVTKLADTEKPDWWRIRTSIGGADREGFSKRTLMNPVLEDVAPIAPSDLLGKALKAVAQLAPKARDNYVQALRNGQALFDHHGITTPRRMAHFLAQSAHETGRFTILRESMRYSAPRILEVFGVGKHSAKVTPAEAKRLAGNEEALAERVYGLGNPKKADELGNTRPGDGFVYRGNGVLQTTGRGAHKRMGDRCGVDFENDPALMTLAEHALKPALQEWSDGKLNPFADVDDIERITRKINGGLNGFEERKKLFALLLPRLS